MDYSCYPCPIYSGIESHITCPDAVDLAVEHEYILWSCRDKRKENILAIDAEVEVRLRFTEWDKVS